MAQLVETSEFPAMQTRPSARSRRHGVALLYLLISFAMLAGFASLGIDLARVQTAKTELQRAADSAARHGAEALGNTIFGVSAAPSNAVAAALANTVDGQPLVLDSTNDVTLGIWNSSTKTFTSVTDQTTATAIKIVAHREASRGTAIPLMFASLLGKSSCDITATSIALFTPGASITETVPATSNPFLAGMPSGTVASLNNPHNNPDYAPQASPVYVSGLNVTPGSSMSFDGINGGANNFASSTLYSADGNFGWICNNTNWNENGIANITAPINSLVGIFLTDAQPNLTSAPANLDYTSDTERDFSTVKPALQQIFFIGDGRRDNGEVQQFVVPTGATRFYLATWDTYEWNNNVGSFNATVHNSGTVSIVQ